MRYSLESNHRKYVKVYGFMSFAKNFGDKYGKKLMGSATKTGKEFAKAAGKKVIHKSAEVTGDLVGSKIADKSTSVGKPRSKKEKDEDNVMEETQEMMIPPKKRKQVFKDLKLF